MCSDANRDTRSSALRGSCPGTGRELSKCILELGHETLIQIYPVFCSPFGCWHQRPGWAWDPKAQRYLQSFGAWSCAPFPCLEAGVNAWTSGVWGTRCTLLARGCVCRVGWGVVLLLPGVKFTPAPPSSVDLQGELGWTCQRNPGVPRLRNRGDSGTCLECNTSNMNIHEVGSLSWVSVKKSHRGQDYWRILGVMFGVIFGDCFLFSQFLGVQGNEKRERNSGVWISNNVLFACSYTSLL